MHIMYGRKCKGKVVIGDLQLLFVDVNFSNSVEFWNQRSRQIY